ncbi:hypothetical protein [Ramlibacter albus]|uniref:Uncharacterized protein n=1 Tax=Ramlibacter albus TaxID=2079448 RepID=A0A923S599_9BURK|nr:hypothetical protein [Ramlibacter albus]MBC5768306.1 hypothetical protein [Ramlibacter albus]
MFDQNTRAEPKHRYQASWMTEPAAQFEPLVTRWLHDLDRSQIMGGPTTSTRKALTQEFLAGMYVYDLILKQYRTELRELGIGGGNLSMMELNFAIAEIDARINKYQQLYRAKWNKACELGTEYANLQNFTQEVMRALKPAALKRALIRRKRRLVEYWIHGAYNFDQEINPNIDLQLQFLANSIPEQVQLILEVMTKDAAKLMNLPDPTKKFNVETGSGFETSSSVEWTNEDFQRTVKCEASASYGVRASAKGEWEFTGLKAQLEASAFAGANVEAELEASIGREGVSVQAKVLAEIGVKLKFDASMEVLGVFTASLGGEAFAGAMAQAEIEITATRTDGLKVKLEAEAFAGIKCEGTASFEFKFQGLSILKGSATGKLALGAGIAGKLEFECSPMGATSFSIGGDVTLGIGGGFELEFEYNSDNFRIAAGIAFYKAYLYLLKDELESYAYSEYFQGMEVNVERLKKALEYLKKCELIAEEEYNAAANANVRLMVFKNLADSRWRRRDLPMIRPKALSTETVQTGLSTPTRRRSNAVTSRPPSLTRQTGTRAL